ncbi:VOC family protein [Pseudactinotalea sp. HY160]|uniref:VOC family protein n=1 Tax=Pseudactinotalea sp. HY160 TaxID=2654490 RepID=UPI00128E0603|nr:VOC family protein [Pseudactinotalea sp. HY160]MPV51180.1 VOC family protein [Pseudactinotalea sp. HY160]
MQRIVPNIWCRRNAVEVGDFYAGVFPNAASEVTARYPQEGLLDFQRDFAGEPLVVDVTIRGHVIRLINAGEEFLPNPALSFLVNVDPADHGGDEQAALAEIDRLWHGLGEGGVVRIEIGEQPYSRRYGWVEDRYGVNWQLMYTETDAGEGNHLVPDFLFTTAEPRAREAIEFYTGLIQGSRIGQVIGKPEEPAGVMFADFTLAGQMFAAMDGGAEHEFTFTPGFSLEIACDGQAEIDRLWEALSSVPEAEQCGWCMDRFGVSWQIVPANMGELMERPGAFETMLAMKKLVIADF